VDVTETDWAATLEELRNMTDKSGTTSISAAAEVWNQRGVDLVEVERFIHDDHPMDRLVERGEGLVGLLKTHFPWAIPSPGAVAMEIGSGVGYPLQAALKLLNPSRIIGLDVADGMIMQAKERLARDKITDQRIEFLLYDGVHIPIEDSSIDFVYSVAALQHVPRLGVYNLLFEIKRILKPGGYCSAQTLAFSMLDVMRKNGQGDVFQKQIEGQIQNKPFGWVSFYSFEELLSVLVDAVDVRDIHIVERGGSLWFCFCKEGARAFHHPWLPRLRHEAVRGLYEGL
jgi:ubiquinone/menaquinone biosynthesis C-methylase UbiE